MPPNPTHCSNFQPFLSTWLWISVQSHQEGDSHPQAWRIMTASQRRRVASVPHAGRRSLLCTNSTSTSTTSRPPASMHVPPQRGHYPWATVSPTCPSRTTLPPSPSPPPPTLTTPSGRGERPGTRPGGRRPRWECKLIIVIWSFMIIFHLMSFLLFDEIP